MLPFLIIDTIPSAVDDVDRIIHKHWHKCPKMIANCSIWCACVWSTHENDSDHSENVHMRSTMWFAVLCNSQWLRSIEIDLWLFIYLFFRSTQLNSTRKPLIHIDIIFEGSWYSQRQISIILYNGHKLKWFIQICVLRKVILKIIIVNFKSVLHPGAIIMTEWFSMIGVRKWFKKRIVYTWALLSTSQKTKQSNQFCQGT